MGEAGISLALFEIDGRVLFDFLILEPTNIKKPS
jgi:hypothetical protein